MVQQPLAVKFRPKTFDDVVEQDNIKIILQQQLESNAIKNVYLFCGPAGDGKTTTARILANEINKGQGNPIELDAASNNSVDDMRDLIKQAKTKSLDSDYKVFIVDECFHGDTLISTLDGSAPIRNIKVGDVVRNMSGTGTVTHVFKNRVFTNRLCCVTINGVKTYTTVDHLYFTQDGWVEAKNLQKGDIVYAPTYMRSLWERVCKQTQGSEILLQYLCSQSTRRGTASKEFTESCYKILCDLWETIFREPIKQEDDVFVRLQSKIYKYSREKYDMEYRTWGSFKETILKENVGEQSYEQSRSITEDDKHSQIKWYLEYLERTEGWKRAVHNTSTNFMGSLESSTYLRISNSNEDVKGFGVSNMLQSRPKLSRENACDRGGWERTQIEVFYGKGRKENQVSNVYRVDSVEIYKRGYNDKLFRSGFADSELSKESVNMYDLEVEGHHSYFANGVLVHNCHMITNAGWNAILKLIEEPPAKSVFIFCTTDPQKIPKTIISRVQRYTFNRISTEGLVKRLDYILDNERDEDDAHDMNAIEYIARLSDGGMRDAITLMDKCLAYSKDLTLENVVKALGTVDYDTMIDLTDYIYCGNSEEVLSTIENIHNSGKDLKQFVKQYLQFVLDCNKYGLGCDWKYINIPRLDNYEKWLDTNVETRVSFYLDLLDVLVELNTNIKYSATPKYEIEATLLTRLNRGK